MNVADPQTISIWAQMLIAPIALLIASIALMGYIRVKSGSSLLLSISFFLLACPSFLPIMEALGLFRWPTFDQGFDYIIEMIKILDIISIFQISAFALLAFVYLSELKNRTIEFGRFQLDVLAAALAAVIVYSLYIFNKYSGNSLGHPIFPFVSAVLSVVMMLIIVALMFSFYQAKGNKNTLLGMVGFLLILSYEAYLILSYDPGVWSEVQFKTGGWPLAVVMVTSLAGYIVFLAAIIRARVAHG